MNPGELLRAFAPLLPAPITTSADYPPIQTLFDQLGADLAAYSHYLEWNLRSGELDPTFTFPTHIDRTLRLPVQDLFDDGLAPRDPAVVALLARLAALPLDTPLFPRAISCALERLTESPAVAFLFLDYGPELEPDLLADALALLDPKIPAADVDALGALGADLKLAHVGAGRRAGRSRRKAYYRGRLAQLVDRAAASGLLGPHRASLDALAESIGERSAHLVADAEAGRVVRVGFELNLPDDQGDDYPERVTRSPLWLAHADAQPEVIRLLAPRPHLVALPDGGRAEMMLCHLKLSFDGDARPEWKAYLRFMRT